MIRGVLGSRASIGGVLGSGRGGAAAWYLAGGVSAANCVAAYQPKGAASLSASYTNLANPGTYNAAPGTAPTWDATNGWIFAAASTQWLETGITPVNNQTWSGIVRFSNFTGGGLTGCFFGLIQGPRFAITQTTTNARVFQNGGFLAVTVGAPTVASGVFAVAGNQGYYNGSTSGGTIPAGGAAFTGTIAIGQTKETGYNYYLSSYMQAIAIYNTALTSTQIGLISTAMAAL